MKKCSPVEGPTLENFVKDLLPWVGPHRGAGEQREEEGVAETMCNAESATPLPIQR